MKTTRRSFLATTVEAAAGPLAAFWISEPAFGKDQPNVLFIAIDDLNDRIGCLGGHPDTCTPNMDRLASRGVNFTRSYCTAPFCNPSRGSLMTNLRPSTTGVYNNQQPFRWARPGAVNLGQHLRANGY